MKGSRVAGEPEIDVMQLPPMLSIIVAAKSSADLECLHGTVASLVGQSSIDWQLVVAADVSLVRSDEFVGSVENVFAKQRLSRNPGDASALLVTAFDGCVAEGWAKALDEATGVYAMVLDAGTLLASEAVEIIAAELARHGFPETPSPLPELLYGDEDMIDSDGHRSDAFYKPAYSPDRLRVHDYVGEAVLYRRDVVSRIGGLRPTHERAARYDLTLRVAEQAEFVIHVPAILAHVAETEESVILDGAVAAVVQEHLERTMFPAEAISEQLVPDGVNSRHSVVTRIAPRLDRQPMASVIIPTGGSSRVVRGRRQRLIDLALESLKKTNYPNMEIVVVFDRHSSDELMASVRSCLAGRPHEIVQDSRPFNYSQACNLGVARSRGDVLVFLNDDTEIVAENWLDRMVMFAIGPQVGAVGVKLLYEDGRLQHTGVWAREGHVAHRYSGFAGDHPGVRGALLVQLNCSAVTAACMAVERVKFEDVGGFCTDLPLAFNDVDLCFKLQMAGFRSLVDNDNIVVHLESSSRNPSTHQWELDHLHHRWRPVMYFDPYENPNNTGRDCDEYPPTPSGLADARWQANKFHRAGRTWRRAPIAVGDGESTRWAEPTLVSVEVRS